MKSALFLASIALVLQLCPSFVIYNGPTRLVGEFMLSLKPSSHGWVLAIDNPIRFIGHHQQRRQ